MFAASRITPLTAVRTHWATVSVNHIIIFRIIHKEPTGRPSRQKAGFFDKRQKQVSPVDSKAIPGSDRGSLRSRLSVSGRSGGFAGTQSEENDVQR